jgi:hypothetical protein
MSSYLPEPRNGLFPSRLGHKLERAFEHQEAQALVNRHDDRLRIGRVEEATARGLVAVAQLSGLEATLVRAAPHAEGRLRAIADAGTIGIAGIVARSGF